MMFHRLMPIHSLWIRGRSWRGILQVRRLSWEPGTRGGKALRSRLDDALGRLATLVGATSVDVAGGSGPGRGRSASPEDSTSAHLAGCRCRRVFGGIVG